MGNNNKEQFETKRNNFFFLKLKKKIEQSLLKAFSLLKSSIHNWQSVWHVFHEAEDHYYSYLLPCAIQRQMMQLYRKIFEQSQFLIHPVHALVRRARKTEGWAAVFLSANAHYLCSVWFWYLGKQMPCLFFSSPSC